MNIDVLQAERRRVQLNACKGLHYLIDNDYLTPQSYFVGADNKLVHTVILSGKRGKPDFHLGACPICGSKFIPGDDSDRPPVPNCANPEREATA